jgi:hypothetical protein
MHTRQCTTHLWPGARRQCIRSSGPSRRTTPASQPFKIHNICTLIHTPCNSAPPTCGQGPGGSAAGSAAPLLQPSIRCSALLVKHPNQQKHMQQRTTHLWPGPWRHRSRQCRTEQTVMQHYPQSIQVHNMYIHNMQQHPPVARGLAAVQQAVLRPSCSRPSGTCT